MCARAPCTVLPCGSTTAFLGVIMIFAFTTKHLSPRTGQVRPFRTRTRAAFLFWRGQKDEIPAAILPPGSLVVARIHWFVLAVADGIHTGGIDAKPDQFFPESQGAALTQRAVVFFGAALVAIAFDTDSIGRAAFQI